eukprot:EG_transcript_3189
MDDDAEDDQWLSAQRNKQSKEATIYGVFLDDDEEEEERKRRKPKYDARPAVQFVPGNKYDPNQAVKPPEAEDEASREKAGDEPTDNEEEEAPKAAEPPARKFFVVMPAKRKAEEEAAEEPPPKKPESPDGAEGGLAPDFAAFLDGTRAGRAVWSMLSKAGFRGRLGRQEQGMAEAIQVKARPNRAGLGRVDEKTAQQKRWEREVRGQRGEADLEDDEPGPGLGGRPPLAPPSAAAAGLRAPPRRRGGWRKGAALQPSKAKDVDDIVGTVRREKIIDMRGPQVQILDGLAALSGPAVAAAPEGSLKELRHNVQLLVRMTELDIQTVADKLRVEEARLERLQRDFEKVAKESATSSSVIQDAEDLLRCLDLVHQRVAALQPSAFIPGKPQPDINMSTLAKTLRSLQEKFELAYETYDITRLGVAIGVALLKKTTHHWRPLDNPTFAQDGVARWRALLNGESDSNEGEWYPCLVAEGVFPKLQVALQGQWDVLDAAPAAELVHSWAPLLPVRLKGELLDIVLSRLQKAVEDWDPRGAKLSVHVWVHPWLPLLGRQFEAGGLFKTIRFKLGEVLRQARWLPNDSSALNILLPWAGVFLEPDLHAFLDRYILPALTAYLRAIELRPAQQDFTPWKHVMAWQVLLPATRLAQLIVEEFFPKFSIVLHGLLRQPQPDYEQVMAWYLQWREAMPTAVQDADAITVQWDRALEMMNAAMEGETVPLSAPQDIEALNRGAAQEIQRERFRAEQARAISRATFLETERSFREEVEEFAMAHDFVFAPKKGMSHDGKPLYSFGSVTCYLDNKLLYTQQDDRWRPCSLEQLLKRAEARRGR